MDAAGGAVGKRVAPIVGRPGRGRRAAVDLRKRRKRKQQQVRARRELTASRIEPVFDPDPTALPRRARASTPASRAAATASCARDAGTFERRRLRRDPHAAARRAARTGSPRCLRELDALIVELRPMAVAVERVLFQVNTRTAMSVGQASGLALAIAGRGRRPGGAVQPQRGEARGRRRRRRGQGRGADDGRPAPAARARSPSRPTPPTRSRSRCATGGARRCCRGAGPCRTATRRRGVAAELDAAIAAAVAEGGRAVIGSVRGTVLERTASGEVLVEVGGVGLPRARAARARSPALAPGRRRVPVHAPARPRGRAWCSTGSRRATSATRSRRCIGATGVGPKLALGDALGALARRRCGARCSTTTSPRSRWCPASASAPRSGCSSS